MYWYLRMAMEYGQMNTDSIMRIHEFVTFWVAWPVAHEISRDQETASWAPPWSPSGGFHGASSLFQAVLLCLSTANKSDPRRI